MSFFLAQTMGRSNRSRSRSRSDRHRHRSRKQDSDKRLKRLERTVEELTKAVHLSIGKAGRSKRSLSRSSSTNSERSTDSFAERRRTRRSVSSIGSNSKGSIVSIFDKSNGSTRPRASNEADILATNAIQNHGNLPSDVLQINADDDDVHAILGTVPDATVKQGNDLNPALAERWNAIVRTGIPKEEREKIQGIFKDPANAETGGPKLNPEIKKSIPPIVRDNDGEIMSIQNHLAVGLNGIGLTISELMANREDIIDRKQILTVLSDCGRYLCGTQYALSLYRRKQIKRSFKNENMKEALGFSPLYPMLFGSDMNDVIKAAENSDKIGRNLNQKVTPRGENLQTTSKPANQRATRSTVTLNSSHPSARFQPKSQRGGRLPYQNRRRQ